MGIHTYLDFAVITQCYNKYPLTYDFVYLWKCLWVLNGFDLMEKICLKDQIEK